MNFEYIITELEGLKNTRLQEKLDDPGFELESTYFVDADVKEIDKAIRILSDLSIEQKKENDNNLNIGDYERA